MDTLDRVTLCYVYAHVRSCGPESDGSPMRVSAAGTSGPPPAHLGVPAPSGPTLGIGPAVTQRGPIREALAGRAVVMQLGWSRNRRVPHRTAESIPSILTLPPIHPTHPTHHPLPQRAPPSPQTPSPQPLRNTPPPPYPYLPPLTDSHHCAHA